MSNNQNENENEIVQLWNELNVARVNFEFSCGGDSMNDTTITIHGEDDEEIENVTLETYFDSEVYNAVEFYVNSDGHYQGESGYVNITLDEDGENFNYSKYSESEWTETVTTTTKIELTDEQVAFINDKVLNINGSYDEVVVNYKQDCILSDEEEEIAEELERTIQEQLNNYTPEQDEGELQEDWFTFTTNPEGETLKIVGNGLQVQVNNSVTVFKEE
jgi:hypothetical protein